LIHPEIIASKRALARKEEIEMTETNGTLLICQLQQQQ